MLGGRVARLNGTEVTSLAPVAGRPERPLPVGLAFDSGGRLWVAESGAERLVSYDTATGEGKSYPLPIGFWGPTDVKIAPDGLVWVSGHGTSVLGAVNPATGDVTVWPVSRPDNPESPVARPSGIAIDAQGQVWAAEHEGNRIARIMPAHNLVVEYALPKVAAKEPWPQWLSGDSEGAVWYASWGTSRDPVGSTRAPPTGR